MDVHSSGNAAKGGESMGERSVKAEGDKGRKEGKGTGMELTW